LCDGFVHGSYRPFIFTDSLYFFNHLVQVLSPLPPEETIALVINSPVILASFISCPKNEPEIFILTLKEPILNKFPCALPQNPPSLASPFQNKSKNHYQKQFIIIHPSKTFLPPSAL
jgi:hypothetical protein